MKNLTYILLLIFGTLQAQYTQIPDGNFEGRLISAGYDDVFDGRVLTANIVTVTVLNLTQEFIYDLTGVQDFTALEELHARDNSLTTIDLSQNTNLKILNVNGNELVSLDLTGNPNLEYVSCFSQWNGNNLTLTNVDVSLCYSLVHLELGNNTIPSNINVSNSPNLEYLNLAGSMVTSLDLINNLNLVYLNLWGNHLTSLDLSQNTLLTELNLMVNENLTSLNLSNNINLEQLTLGYDSLTELDLSNNVNLKFLRYDSWDPEEGLGNLDDKLTTINLSNCISLEQVLFWQTNLISLDFSDCINLKIVDISLYFNLTSLNLKNGNNEILEDITINDYHFTPETLFCIEVDDPDLAINNLPPYTASVWGNYFSSYIPSEDCSTLSLDDIALEEDIKLYPNPAINNFKVLSNPNTTINNIIVYDQLGKIVKTVNSINKVEIDNLEKGVYFVKIELQDKQVITKQLIKS